MSSKSQEQSQLPKLNPFASAEDQQRLQSRPITARPHRQHNLNTKHTQLKHDERATAEGEDQK